MKFLKIVALGFLGLLSASTAYSKVDLLKLAKVGPAALEVVETTVKVVPQLTGTAVILSRLIIHLISVVNKTSLKPEVKKNSFPAHGCQCFLTTGYPIRL